MPFTILTNSLTAFANEVMDNFYFIADGHRLPRGAGSMTAQDSTYDLGSSAVKWKNLYCNNLYVNSSITSSTLVTFVAQDFLPTFGGATEVEFTGLNGDSTDYFFAAEVGTSSNTGIYMSFNGISGTNYTYRSLLVRHASVGAGIADSVSTAQARILLSVNTQTSEPYCVGRIYSKTGANRLTISRSCDKGTTNPISSQNIGVWDDTTSTITSIKFSADSNYKAPGAGALFKITLWGVS